jgi:hypothetical protein
MKILLFSIYALLTVTISVAQKPIVIRGKIDNCSNRNISYIEKKEFNTKTLQEESTRTKFPISEDGTFRVEIREPDDFYVRYWIHLGNEFTHLDLISGDSIYMTLNSSWFDESIKYSGRGAGRNNYRRDVFLEFWDRNTASKLADQDNPNQFLNGLNSLTERKLELLNKYFFSGEIDSSYYMLEKTQILNEKANQILSHYFRYRNHANLNVGKSRQLDSALEAASFSDDHLLQFNDFRGLIRNLPGYMVEHDYGKSGRNLKKEIEFADTHYTNVLKLYFDSEIIKKYMRQAQSQSEQRALLSFFSAQFQEPVLKMKLQEEGRYMNNREAVNSSIFQGTLFTIFFLIALFAAFLALVKLMKITKMKRIEFHFPPWMQGGLYLIMFWIAFVYVMNNPSTSQAMLGVLLMLATFFAHKYLLIPKYALQGDYQHYFQWLGAAFLVCMAGLSLCDQKLSILRIILANTCLFTGLGLLSWTSYYLDRLRSREITLKELIKNGELNLELAFNLILVFLVDFIFVINTGGDNILNESLVFYTIIGLFYFHTFFSWPRFFSKEQAARFIGINVAILLGIATVMIVLDGFQSYNALMKIGVETKLIDLLSTKNIRTDMLLVFTLMLIPSFIYFFIKRRIKDLELTGFSLYRNKEAELAQLRSQVNPHFLFNTLNTLYAFALNEGSEKTAECIAKLANLMRFMLDDMDKESILLQREISYIQDYVKLQSIRSAVEHDISITVEIGEENGYSIAPMLLIPFVENAFKHGMNPNKASLLRIDITAKEHKIQFVIENSVDENFEAYYKEKGFGIGIENVKSRLKYIYPGRHNISIAKTADKFMVILTIELN